MTAEKVTALMSQFKDYVPQDKIAILKNALTRAGDESYEVLSMLTFKSSTTTLLLSIFLGWLGVDRFYIGDIGIGVCKLLFGLATMYIWPLIDIFISYKKAKEKNLNKILAAAI